MFSTTEFELTPQRMYAYLINNVEHYDFKFQEGVVQFRKGRITIQCKKKSILLIGRKSINSVLRAFSKYSLVIKTALIKLGEHIGKNSLSIYYDASEHDALIYNRYIRPLDWHVSIDEAKEALKTGMIRGMEISISDNLRLFFEKGLECYICGEKITHFSVERCPNGKSYTKYHLNARTHNGSLANIDHFIPKWLLSLFALCPRTKKNLFPCCARCNKTKGGKIPKPTIKTHLEPATVLIFRRLWKRGLICQNMPRRDMFRIRDSLTFMGWI